MDSQSLRSRKVGELKEIAKSLKIKGYSTMKKEELIENIEYLAIKDVKEEGGCEIISFKPQIKEEKLIRSMNCLELPLQNIKYILGPSFFYKFVLGDRNIYLFGEIHQPISKSIKKLAASGATKDNTLLFSSFVNSLVKQNPKKTYDLMLELPYVRSNEPFQHPSCDSAMINDLWDQFKDCLAQDKTMCGYDNLRVHYVDYRQTSEKGTKPFIESKKHSKELLKEILEGTGKVVKQIMNIKDETIRGRLIDFFKEFTEKYPEADECKMVIMDIYAISRILRDFEMKEKPRTKTFTGTSQNVIYYAGLRHIETMIIFLIKYIGIKPVANVGGFTHRLDHYLGIELDMSKVLSFESFLELDISKHPGLF